MKMKAVLKSLLIAYGITGVFFICLLHWHFFRLTCQKKQFGQESLQRTY